MSEHFDPAPASAEIAAATARLLDTIRSMSDDDVPGPSLLPGWTRGHVLSHVARNADGLCNLLLGAIEGAERHMYPSPEARDADIEAGSRRPLKEHVAEIEAANERFVAVAERVPASRWSYLVRWGSRGDAKPATEVLDARLREVAIHHVDLDAGYTPTDWSPLFALRILRLVLPAFESRGLRACTLRATDVDSPAAVVSAGGGSAIEISGPAHALATWLLGRDSGATLAVAGGELPKPPAW